ncbi:MAG: GreA/GreB family elongation factor [Geobacteraceae bacterium]|nr:GreA/GreB family elongation factor [Geobacteraceae bacterium]
MNKRLLVSKIIDRLSNDLEIIFSAAKSAHEASTNSENLPDNKYDTLALEASYVAQGQANRAAELRGSIEIYRQLQVHEVKVGAIRLASFVILSDEDGVEKNLFIGPAEGGLKIEFMGEEVIVITPASPMGRELLGKNCGDVIEIETTSSPVEYEIVEIR